MNKSTFIFIVIISFLFTQQWPLDNIVFTSAYGPRIINSNYDFHLGLDLQASIGTDVFASMDGYVAYVDEENTTGAGNQIKIYNIENNEGYSYYHLSEVYVGLNADVEQGQIIGKSGNTAGYTNIVSPHLHFMYYKGGYGNSNSRHPLNSLEYYNSYGPSPEITSAICAGNESITHASVTVETSGEELDLIGFKLEIWPYEHEIDFDLTDLYRTDNNPFIFYLDENDLDTQIRLTTIPQSFNHNNDDSQKIEFRFDFSQFNAFEFSSDDLCFSVRDVEDRNLDDYQDYECYFTLVDLLGDVDGDGYVNIIDIIQIINYILGIIEFDSNQLHFADYTQDNIVNIVDVVAIVNLILGDITFNDPPSPDPIILSNIIRQRDNPPFVMEVNMLNRSIVRGTQLSIKIPSGFTPISVDKGSYAEDMNMAYAFNSNNTVITFLTYGATGEYYNNGYGTLLEVGLEFTGLSRSDGDEDGDFTEVVLTNANVEYLDYEIVTNDDFERIVDNDNINNELPQEASLSSIYPNPFNPITNITYEIPEESHISISIYDLAGRKVDELVNGNVQAGRFNTTWNAEKYSSGLYIINMTTPKFTTSQKVVLLK